MQLNVRREGDTFALTFAYDPAVVAAVKTLPGRTWNTKLRRWELPYGVETYDAIAGLARRFGVGIVVAPDVVAEVERERRAQAEAAAIIVAGDADDADIGSFPFKTTPYAHQRAGLAYLLKMGSAGLTWDMGTGKTKAVIDWCEWLAGSTTETLRVLVLAPNGVVDKWGDEVFLHAGHRDYVLLRAPATLLQRSRLAGTRRYTILNHEAISHDGPLTTTLGAIEWDVVIVDESHRFKNPRARRTKRLLKLHAKRRAILTGTPVTNSPEDAWSQLTFIRPGILGSWWAFQQDYLMRDFFGNVTGVRPEKEPALAAAINSVTYRVRKQDVLDLPEKVYETVRVELTPMQRALYTSMKQELRLSLDSGDVVVAHSILSQLLRLTQITAGIYGEGDTYDWDERNAKVMELDRILNEDLRDEQVVVFGIYRRELEELAKRYSTGRGDPPWDPRIIYGGISPGDRATYIDDFQKGRRRLLFVQAHSGGIGIDLTAAQYAVYYTRSWSLEDYQQSQDRLHRIGQQGTVTIIHLVAKDTVDDQITRALAQKHDLARRLTGDAARQLAREVLTR